MVCRLFARVRQSTMRSTVFAASCAARLTMPAVWCAVREASERPQSALAGQQPAATAAAAAPANVLRRHPWQTVQRSFDTTTFPRDLSEVCPKIRGNMRETAGKTCF